MAGLGANTYVAVDTTLCSGNPTLLRPMHDDVALRYQSASYRSKWDEQHRATTYGAMTIAKAFNSSPDAHRR